MINKNLNFEKLKEEYKQKKRIVIRDFLEPDIAEQVYEGFLDLTERHLWYQVNYGDPRYYNKKLKGDAAVYAHFSYKFEKFPLTNFKLSHLIDFDARRKDISKLVKNNEEHPENELSEFHPLRKVSSLLNSRQGHDFISSLTGQSLTYDSCQCFASKYVAGDFNGSHSDADYSGNSPRKVAYVFNMTKNWLVHWGGNLIILDHNFENVIEDYTPKFNSLIVFDVPLAHAVLPVSTYCQSERYALTGWYYDLNSLNI
jgi:Rps23 Pro-64 3,4-dihydroxylase Tpa1-like proline 4-hydroxylase